MLLYVYIYIHTPYIYIYTLHIYIYIIHMCVYYIYIYVSYIYITYMYPYWLVVSTPLKNTSKLGWLFPIHGTIKAMFQTTNQHIYIYRVNLWLANSYIKYYPLVICYIAIENDCYIVDFPMKNGDFPWSEVAEGTSCRSIPHPKSRGDPGWWRHALSSALTR